MNSNKGTVYIAGKISGDPDYKAKFERARIAFDGAGFIALAPSVLPSTGFEYAAYIRIAAAMLDECEAVCFLPDWTESKGAMYEYGRATAGGKRIFYYDEWERANAALECREASDGE
jgi:nucleoside 2-deoxyribosyltransferase